MENVTKDQALQILRDFYRIDQASIQISQADTPYESAVITLDLSKSGFTRDNPFPISFPYKSIYVSDATDASAKCFLLPDTIDSFQGGILLQLKDSINFETKKAKSYLYWEAQAGKTITLTIFMSARFESGSNIVRSTVSLPSSFDENVEDIILATGTPQEILPADSGRASATIRNKSATSFYIGQGGGLSTTNGIEVKAGAQVQIVNTGQLLVVGTAGQGYAILVERS